MKINGINLNFTEAGETNQGVRPTLPFLHYFGGSARSWREVTANLEKDFHCVALDQRGFGDSQNPAASYQLKDYADDAAALVRTLELENFALVGHSMGGKIALLYAARAPSGLRSLILIAPSPPSPEPMTESERQKMLTTHGTRRAAAAAVENAVARKLPPEIFERAVADNLKGGEVAWKAWLEVGSREDFSGRIAVVKTPTLVIAGEQDETMTADLLTREIVEKINEARLVVLKNAKHLLPYEAANEIAGAIAEFV